MKNGEIRTTLFLLGFKDVFTTNAWKMEREDVAVEYIDYNIWHEYKICRGNPEYIEYWSKIKLTDWMNNEEEL